MSEKVILSTKQTFSLQNLSYFLKRLLDVTFGKAYLTQAFDIGEFFATVFEKDNRLCESKSALKQPAS